MKNLNYPDQRQADAKLGAPGPTDRLLSTGLRLDDTSMAQRHVVHGAKHLKVSILHTSSLTFPSHVRYIGAYARTHGDISIVKKGPEETRTIHTDRNIRSEPEKTQEGESARL